MKISLLVLGDPAGTTAAADALAAARSAVTAGEKLYRLFFYSDAVQVARAGAHPLLAASWADLAAEADAELIACSSSAIRRDILDEREAAPLDQPANLAGGFMLAGLGQLAEAILQSDQLLIFGRQCATGSAPSSGDRQVCGAAPLVRVTHAGADAGITRESLDLAMALAAFLPGTALIFCEAGAAMLRRSDPQNRHDRALRALREYGLEDVYVSDSDLQSHGMTGEDLCIPCRIVDDAACQELIERHRPVITL